MWGGVHREQVKHMSSNSWFGLRYVQYVGGCVQAVSALLGIRLILLKFKGPRENRQFAEGIHFIAEILYLQV
jgi:hypothetical protein